MASFLKHTSCPACGSRDNLAEYSDGSAWCFGCKYYRRPNLHTYTPLNSGPKTMPYFVVNELPQRVIDWITSYKVNPHWGNWYWAPEAERAFWRSPVNDFWIGRRFGNNGPKWIAYGKKPVCVFGESKESRIYVVEDVISAYAVNRFNAFSMPLFGTSLSNNNIDRINHFSTIVVWLDRDKANDAIKMSRDLRQRGITSSVLITEKDPKEVLCYKSLSEIT